MNRLLLLCGTLLLAACTSDPHAAVNNVFPIRQMDRLFGDPHSASPNTNQVVRRPEDDVHRPGYLPAYPPLNGVEASGVN